MAVSLAFTAGGILLGYLLVGARARSHGQTMNARPRRDRLRRLAGRRAPRSARCSSSSTLISEGALLFVAAQTGFLDGPRVLANMAVDSWVPHRFAQLSDRLVTKNGVLLMGLAAIAMLSTRAAPSRRLVVMYSINVFLTFTLTLLGMSRHWIAGARRAKPTGSATSRSTAPASCSASRSCA